MEPLFLSLDEVLEIHEQQIERYGGSSGLRDAAGLESAAATLQATFGGEFLLLLLNDWEPISDEEELVDLVLSVAAGGLSKPRLIEIFESRCKPSEGP